MKYIVKEEEKMVIAIIEDTEFDVMNYIKAVNDDLFLFGNDMYNKLLLNNTYKGIAKCHPDDEFDVEKGKKIAKARAVFKHDSAFNKKLNYYYDHKMEIFTKMKNKSSEKYFKALRQKEKVEKMC